MPTADTISANSSPNSFLFKGSYGFGKTLAAASYAVEGPVYLAYIDKKFPVELEKFFKHIIKRPELLKNIEFDIYSSKNVNEYLNKLISFTKYCDKFAVITDSLTTLTASAVNWSLGFRDPAGAKKDPLNSNAVLTIPGWDEYKVETSLITQALDLCRAIPAHIIWTAHPLPQIKIDGGSGMKIEKSNSLVSYGSKVAALVPGQFSEIYHFYQEPVWDANAARNRIRYMVSTEAMGDEFAKSSLKLPKELNITDNLFYEVWKSSLI